MNDELRPRRSSGNLVIWILLVLALVGLAYFLLRPGDTSIPETKITKPLEPVVQKPVEEPEVAPLQEYEAPQTVVEFEPLPSLNNSHQALL